MAGRQRPAQGRSRRRAEWSQHHLRPGPLPARLIQLARIDASDRVLEIGPGRGVLTRLLARRCSRLTAVEIDPVLARSLACEFEQRPAVEVACGDFLAHPLPRERFRVVANLPFRKTSEIIRRLTLSDPPPDDIHVVVQREAGLRHAGEPYGPDRLASLLLKPWWHSEIVSRIEPSAFDPPPSVASVLLWLARRRRPLVLESEAQLYRDFLAASFGRRGETLRASLSVCFSRKQQLRLARDLRFELQARPSTLGFDRWLALFRFFAASSSVAAREAVSGAIAARPRAPL